MSPSGTTSECWLFFWVLQGWEAAQALWCRSHAIFQVLIERKVAAGSAVQMSTLNFVDLAGSERLDKSGNEGEAARRVPQMCACSDELKLGPGVGQALPLPEGRQPHWTVSAGPRRPPTSI